MFEPQTKVLIFFLIVSLLFTGCGGNEKKDSDLNNPKGHGKSPELDGTPEESGAIKKLEALKEEAKQRFEKEIQKEPKFDLEVAKRKLFLKKYGVDITQFPKQKKTKDQVDEIIEKLASEATNLKFPEEKRVEVLEQAEKEFPLLSAGDLIEVNTRRGSVYGVLERVYPDKIKVEKFYILLNDITSPHWACFSSVECQKRRDHFIRVNFEIPKDDFKSKCLKEFAPRIYNEEGYILVKDKWTNVDDLYKEKIEPQIKQLEEKYYENIQKKVRERIEKQMQAEGLYAP